MTQANRGAPARPIPDSDRLPETRRRGTPGVSPLRYCTHCGEAASDDYPVESVGEAGESGCSSMVYAHRDCLPQPRRTTPG